MDAPLIGRSTELSGLLSALDAAQAGRPRAVLLAGDAGVGKTRLLAEVSAAAAARGVTVLLGHCVDVVEGGLPYLPFGEMLATIAAAEELAPALLAQPVLAAHPAVAAVLGSQPGSERTEPGALFEAVAGLVTGLSVIRPLLLIVEDLHWGDQSTRGLLRYLMSRLSSERVCIVASYRSDDLHRRHPLRPLLAELVRLPRVERIELPPLPTKDVAGLIRALHPDPLPADDLRRIIESAEGNAFFAQELLAATMEEPAARPGRGARRTELPGTISEVLLARLEQLPSAAQMVVRCASVAGRRVEHEALRQVAGLPELELEAALREAIGRHLLVPDDDSRYMFRHALLREAAYTDLLPGERVRLHAAFADYFSRPGFGAEYAAYRAHHYWQSHDFPRALTAFVEAADQAADIGAPAEELHHLENALELWSSVPDAAGRAGASEVALLLRASVAAVRAGQGQRSIGLARAALQRAQPGSDTELTARIRYTLAQNLIAIDRDLPAYKESAAALELIPAEPPSSTRLWALATHAMTSMYVEDIEGARRAGAEALAAAELLGADDVTADVMITMLNLRPDGRDTDAGLGILTEALALARKGGNPGIEIRALYGLAMGRYEAGDLEGARNWAREGLNRAASAGLLASPYGVEMHMVLALARYASGDWAEIRAAATVSGVSDVHLAHYGKVLDLLPLAARGDPAVPARVAELLGAPDQHFIVLNTTAAAGIDAAAWDGDADRAMRIFRRAAQALWGWDAEASPEPPVAQLSLAAVRLAALTLAAVTDRVKRLREAGDDADQWVSAGQWLGGLARAVVGSQTMIVLGPEARAWSLRAEAECTELVGEPSASAWRGALEAFGYGDVYEQARCQWRLAAALVEDGEREAARGPALSALAAAERLGATRLRDAAAGLIRRARLDPANSRTAVTLLTPRESEVLALLVRGRTNRQIGRELFISDKTASVHVSNIFAKLGVGNRTEAVSAAHRRGLA